MASVSSPGRTSPGFSGVRAGSSRGAGPGTWSLKAAASLPRAQPRGERLAERGAAGPAGEGGSGVPAWERRLLFVCFSRGRGKGRTRLATRPARPGFWEAPGLARLGSAGLKVGLSFALKTKRTLCQMRRLGAGARGPGHTKAWAGSAGAEVRGCAPPCSRSSAGSERTHTGAPRVPTPAPRAHREWGGRGRRWRPAAGRPQAWLAFRGGPRERGGRPPRPGRPARVPPRPRRGEGLRWRRAAPTIRPGTVLLRPKMAPGRCLPGDGEDGGAWGREGAAIGARTGLPAPAPTPAAARRTGAASVCPVVPPRDPGAAASAAPGPAPEPGSTKAWGAARGGGGLPAPTTALMRRRLGSPRRGGAHLEKANAIGKFRANRQNFY